MPRPVRTALAAALVAALALAVAPPATATQLVLADGFEDAATIRQVLTPGRWSYLQQENGAAVTVSTARAHSGTRSVRFHAPGSGDVLTKSDIGKNDVRWRRGDTVEVGAWFFIERAGALTDLFLLDAECGSCGVQSPGLRVMLSDAYPVIERGELEAPTVRQTAARISVGRWFHIGLRLTLGLYKRGHMVLWVDGRKVIDRPGTTVFPVGAYISDIQVGLTANPTPHLAVMYADDVTVRRALRQSRLPALRR